MLQKALRPTSREPLGSSDGSTSRAEALRLYRQLVLARRVEEVIQQEYAKDEMKTPVHLGIGQEAIPIGVCSVLPPGTKTFGTYRNHALYLAVTQDVVGLFAELYGKATGSAKGKAGSMHLAAPQHGLLATSAVVGTTIPVAVGAAFANTYRHAQALVAVFFGDGAVEEGVFWESLNFACLKRLPILFVCEDNGLAIHTPAHQRQGFRSIPEAVRGFDCHVASGNGSDLSAVRAAAIEMLVQMSEQPKPGFLHLSYFRFLEHVGIREDFDAGYRPPPSAEERRQLDPVFRSERELLDSGCTPDEIRAIRHIVDEEIERSLQAARTAPFAPLAALTEDVFA